MCFLYTVDWQQEHCTAGKELAGWKIFQALMAPRTFSDQVHKTKISRCCGLMCLLEVVWAPWGWPLALPARVSLLCQELQCFGGFCAGSTATLTSTFTSWFVCRISGLYCPKESTSDVPLTPSLEGKSRTGQRTEMDFSFLLLSSISCL